MPTTVNESSATNGAAYTWATVPYTWAQDTDDWNSQYPWAYTVAIGETLAFGETFVNAFGKAVAETMSFAEAIAKTVGLNKTEAVSFAETLSHVWAAQISFAESVTFGEALAKSGIKSLAETLNVVDGTGFAFAKAVAESFNIAESFDRSVVFWRAFSETVSFAESYTKNAGKGIAETITFAEALGKSMGLNPAETLAFAEAFARTVIFNIAIAESFTVGEAMAKVMTISIAEALAILDQYVKKANAIISDLKIANGEMTDAQFADALSNGSMAGYTDWATFIPGDYKFQKIAFRYILQALAQPRPTVPTMTISADVPDIVDRGTASIAAGPGWTWVPFNRTFTSTTGLEVTVTLKSGTVVATPVVQTGTATTAGFYCQLQAADGTFPAGTVGWTAIGY